MHRGDRVVSFGQKMKLILVTARGSLSGVLHLGHLVQSADVRPGAILSAVTALDDAPSTHNITAVSDSLLWAMHRESLMAFADLVGMIA